MDLSILIPDNNVEERKYVIRTIVKDFLGISFGFKVSNEVNDYILLFGNKKIIIKDAFFNNHPDDLSYLDIKNIPERIKWFDGLPILPEKIPMIFGTQLLKISNDCVECGLDIFASSFFMLSRWEELVIEKDVFKRSKESEMFVVKNDIYKIPVVNEYCFFLEKILRYLNMEISDNDKVFRVLLTHDIDDLFRFASLKNFIKNLAGDLLHRGSIRLLLATIIEYIKYQRNQTKDPFDTFDEFMDFSQQFGFRDYFYFKPSVKGEYDYTYNIFDSRVNNIIQNIVRRGHKVGVHPSLNTFQNEEQFITEVQRITSLGIEIKGGRQHYLLYDPEKTFRYWDNITFLEYDCGIGFYDRIGFRSGCCFEYCIFDVKDRTTLRIHEIPLLVMDVAAIANMTRKSLSVDEMYEEIIGLADTTFKYKGNFVLLWHNDNFSRPESKRFKHVYFDVVRDLGGLNKSITQ